MFSEVDKPNQNSSITQPCLWVAADFSCCWMVTDSILAASTAVTVSGNSNCSPKAAQILHHHCCHNTAERSPCNKGAGGVTGSVCVFKCTMCCVYFFFIGFHLIDSHKYQRIRGEFKTVLITLLSSVMQAKHLFCLKLSFFLNFFLLT